MMKSNLSEFLHYRVLAQKYKNSRDRDVEAISTLYPGETKNVCAKLEVELAYRLEEMTNFLGISKRLFIEVAIVEALDMADFIFDAHIEVEGDQ